MIQVFIEVPKKLAAEQEKLLRELAELEHQDVLPHRKSFVEKLKTFFDTDTQPQES
jgi:molecular chaperone DnaJ